MAPPQTPPSRKGGGNICRTPAKILYLRSLPLLCFSLRIKRADTRLAWRLVVPRKTSTACQVWRHGLPLVTHYAAPCWARFPLLLRCCPGRSPAEQHVQRARDHEEGQRDEAREAHPQQDPDRPVLQRERRSQHQPNSS